MTNCNAKHTFEDSYCCKTDDEESYLRYNTDHAK